MFKHLPLVAAILIAAASIAYAVSKDTIAIDHVAYTRAPAFGEDAWTAASVGAATAVYIGPLTKAQRYVIQCIGGGVYFNHASAATGHDASATNGGYLYSGAMLDTVILPGVTYVSLLSASGTVTCRYAMAQ